MEALDEYWGWEMQFEDSVGGSVIGSPRLVVLACLQASRNPAV